MRIDYSPSRTLLYTGTISQSYDSWGTWDREQEALDLIGVSDAAPLRRPGNESNGNLKTVPVQRS